MVWLPSESDSKSGNGNCNSAPHTLLLPPLLLYMVSPFMCFGYLLSGPTQTKDEKYKCPQELLECLILYHFRRQMMNDTQLNAELFPADHPNHPLSVCPSVRVEHHTTVRHEIICTLQLPQLTMATNVPATHNDDRVVNNAYQP